MSSLKDNSKVINSLKGKLSSIISELQDIECNIATKIVDWYLEKSKYYRKHYAGGRLQALPNNMKQGDIVIVNFGINIIPEFSDDDTNGHFALIWGQQGHNFIVIPLTKKKQPKENKYGVNLGEIEGMPDSVDTYAKIDAIRSVSIRRIQRIKEQKEGKITISDPDVLKKVKDVFLAYFT
ncbi:MAG: type II toxin-antitoxin system PemK/MazF family toxin [Clostridium sp.]|nr:type II toxin-antitoxin system PemK/MazF family toxin [Clostridium sp.]